MPYVWESGMSEISTWKQLVTAINLKEVPNKVVNCVLWSWKWTYSRYRIFRNGKNPRSVALIVYLSVSVPGAWWRENAATQSSARLLVKGLWAKLGVIKRLIPVVAKFSLSKTCFLVLRFIARNRSLIGFGLEFFSWSSWRRTLHYALCGQGQIAFRAKFNKSHWWAA